MGEGQSPAPASEESCGEGELIVGRRDDKRLICEIKQLLIAGMSPQLRQAKCLGKPLLIGCVVRKATGFFELQLNRA